MVGGAVSAPRSIGLGCPLPALIVPCRTVQSIVCWTTEAAPKSTACVRRCRTAAEDQKDQNQDRRNRRAALATDPFPAQREAGHQCRETDREECGQTHDRVSGECCFGHRVTISGRGVRSDDLFPEGPRAMWCPMGWGRHRHFVEATMALSTTGLPLPRFPAPFDFRFARGLVRLPLFSLV